MIDKGKFASMSFHPGKIDVELVYIITMDEHTADVVVLSTNDRYAVGRQIKVRSENIIPTFPHSDKILKIVDFICNYCVDLGYKYNIGSTGLGIRSGLDWIIYDMIEYICNHPTMPLKDVFERYYKVCKGDNFNVYRSQKAIKQSYDFSMKYRFSV